MSADQTERRLNITDAADARGQAGPANRGGGSDVQGERNALIDWRFHAGFRPRLQIDTSQISRRQPLILVINRRRLMTSCQPALQGQRLIHPDGGAAVVSRLASDWLTSNRAWLKLRRRGHVDELPEKNPPPLSFVFQKTIK